MAEINIITAPTKDGWTFNVEIEDQGSKTTHEVTMSKADYERLTGSAGSPEDCVRASINFLLEREPREAILSKFNITLIGQYFPEYEAEMAKRLKS